MEYRAASATLQCYIPMHDNIFINAKGVLSLRKTVKSDSGDISRIVVSLVPAAWYETQWPPPTAQQATSGSKTHSAEPSKLCSSPK
mgnify:FL=1